jgi:hypothetical protein
MARPATRRGAAASSGGRGPTVRNDRTTGAPVVFGVISDPHFGSKHCRRADIRQHIARCAEAGASLIVWPGDLIDGEYDDHGRFEGDVVGLDAQVADFLDTVETVRGMSHVAIGGNHCETYWNRVGANAGMALMGAAALRGRSDVTYIGDRYGRVHHQGVIIDLWHPGGKKPNNAFAKLESRAQGYARGDEPDILLAGHWHTFGHFRNGRGVHMFGCPTMQRRGSAFSNSMSGPQSEGALLVSVVPGANGPKHVAEAYFDLSDY